MICVDSVVLIALAKASRQGPEGPRLRESLEDLLQYLLQYLLAWIGTLLLEHEIIDMQWILAPVLKASISVLTNVGVSESRWPALALA